VPDVDRDMCRKAAAECIELARATIDPAKKELLLTRALEWLKLAYSKNEAEFERLVSELNEAQMTPVRRAPMQQPQQRYVGRDFIWPNRHFSRRSFESRRLTLTMPAGIKRLCCLSPLRTKSKIFEGSSQWWKPKLTTPTIRPALTLCGASDLRVECKHDISGLVRPWAPHVSR